MPPLSENNLDPEINRLIKLNKDFYNKIAKEFSATRQSSWLGWEKVGAIITKEFFPKNIFNINPVTFLDVGCGNGRFYAFLKEKFSMFNLKYVGVDSNKLLLKTATSEFSARRSRKVKFINLDIFRSLIKVKDKFDVIVAFGVTHHLPGEHFRKLWLSSLKSYLNINGLLILTFWDFLAQEKEEKIVQKDKNDYLLGWNKSETALRYCHYYSKEELDEIVEFFASKKLKLIKRFKSDGKDGKSNTYLIFKYQVIY